MAEEVCLNCKVLEQNTRKVPLWSAREGNNSLLPTVIHLDKYNPKKSILKEEYPQLTEMSVKILMESKKRDTWVFYWAANKSKDPTQIMSEQNAYGSNTNHGILKTDGDGNCEFILNCPQPYHVDNITYPRHVHYTFLSDDDIWNENINSMVVMCNIDYKQMEKISDTKSHIIINALVDDDNIPNSINLDYKILIEMDRTERKHYLLRFIKKNISKYPKLEALINSNRLKYRNIPIVVYCMDKGCDAGYKLAEYLIDCNIVNVIQYTGGIEEWNSIKNSIKNKTDNDIENDDMEIVEYNNEKYYIHKDSNDVTAEDYELVGKWDPERKKILWYSKDNANKDNANKDNANKDNANNDNANNDNANNDNANNDNAKNNVNGDKKEGEIDIGDRYKEKIVVNKLDGDNKPEEIENIKNESDLDIDEKKELIDDYEIDQILKDENDKDINDLINYKTDIDIDNIDTTNIDDIKGGKKNKLKEIEIYNKKSEKTNLKIKPVKINSKKKMNRKYKKYGISFF